MSGTPRPFPDNATVPRTVTLSRKVTVPVAVAPVDGTETTVVKGQVLALLERIAEE